MQTASQRPYNLPPQLMPPKRPFEYPDQEGKRLAFNTLQYEWIVAIKGNLDAIFAENPDVFIAAHLMWYPVEGRPEMRQAPDVLVAFGRPKGDRLSYNQWQEGGVSPQVVFNVFSPGTRLSLDEFSDYFGKFRFCDDNGVDEYYCLDLDHTELTGWIRKDAKFQEIPSLNGWTSPRLGIHFEVAPDRAVILRPDRSPFLSFQEICTELEALRRQKEEAEMLVQELRKKLDAYEEK